VNNETKKKFEALATKANLERVDIISEFSRINIIKQDRENEKQLMLVEIEKLELEINELESNLKNKSLFGGTGEVLKKYQTNVKNLSNQKKALLEKLEKLNIDLERTEKRLDLVRRELMVTQSKMSKITKISENRVIGEIETNSYIEESNQLEQSASRPKKF
jgi:hypothetical protein